METSTNNFTVASVNTLRELLGDKMIHVGFGKYDALGVFNSELYFQNLANAERNGLQACNHCGRGLNMETASLAIFGIAGCFINLQVEHDQLMNCRNSSGSLAWSWVFLGSECAKNIPAAFRMRYTKFNESKWVDTPAHDEATWGTW